jgi:hypothetical protein
MTEPSNLVATCHCGRATIRLPRKPDSITECNCSLCTKTGFRGVYFSSDELVIDGEFDSYVREDIKQAYLANHRCKTCGILTHWTLLSDPPHERMGVNARLIDQTELAGVPIKQVDGRSWDE